MRVRGKSAIKKRLHWQSSLGKVEVEEALYRDRQGHYRRPFSDVAEIRCRACSLPLQRYIVDFAADIPFEAVRAKLLEHHGVEVAVSALRRITLSHARALEKRQILPKAARSKTAVLIAEMDGSMIPTVRCTVREGAKKRDRRTCRTLAWKEARLCLVRRSESVSPVFAVTLDSPDEAGRQLGQLAEKSGLKPSSRVHGLGDGAPWIAEQMERQFGAQGGYLIDFYHLCDYLAAAAPTCAPEAPKVWLEEQKARFKTGRNAEALTALKPHVEPEDQAETPVRDALRYLSNRPGQFDYLSALQAHLPIGSGEVESAHRSLIQKRLKLPGAWWKPDNAQAMLNLRTMRANQQWNRYWGALLS